MPDTKQLYKENRVVAYQCIFPKGRQSYTYVSDIPDLPELAPVIVEVGPRRQLSIAHVVKQVKLDTEVSFDYRWILGDARPYKEKQAAIIKLEKE